MSIGSCCTFLRTVWSCLSDSWTWAVAEAVARCSSPWTIFVPFTGLSLVCWRSQIWTRAPGVASPVLRRGRISPPGGAGSIPSAGQAPLASFAAWPRRWLMSNLASTLTPSSFSAKLLSAPACAELILPLGQEFALSFIAFIEFQTILPGPFFHAVEVSLKGGQSCQHIHSSAQWWIMGEADGSALYPSSQVI